MSEKQVKTKKRVADHGEVFTAEREVNAMLDLVKQETKRIESRFLEPACGDGNFLAEILRRKLKIVKDRYSKSLSDYEKYAVVAVTSIYGVDILPDNVDDCRNRLFEIFDKEYINNCKNNITEDCRKSVKFILERNILCGDALTLKTSGNEPIIFSEWSLVTETMIKRRDFRLDVLLKAKKEPGIHDKQFSIFGDSADFSEYWQIDPITNETIPKPIKEFLLTDYRMVYEHE